jgi:hypothetical protein
MAGTPPFRFAPPSPSKSSQSSPSARHRLCRVSHCQFRKVLAASDEHLIAVDWLAFDGFEADGNWAVVALFTASSCVLGQPGHRRYRRINHYGSGEVAVTALCGWRWLSPIHKTRLVPKGADAAVGSQHVAVLQHRPAASQPQSVGPIRLR